jgi:EamA domain-containing membrane protein RarD
MDFALSLLVLCAIALVIGAVLMLRKGRRRQAALMLVLAAVMALNVAIWIWPTPGGQTLAASGVETAPAN